MEGIQIKVVQPPRGDNVVHPVGPATQPSTSAPVTVPANHHQQQRQRQRVAFNEFRPFKNWFPWLVPGFTVANIVVFVITMYVNDCPKNSSKSCVAKFLGRFSFQPFKENPLLGPSSSTLEKMGALEVYNMVHQHQAWRLFTCIWLHAGVFHLLANMLSLIFIGIRLEQEFGFVRIGLLYVISGFGGSLLSALFIQMGISVGASGALFGLLGSMLSELITNWTIYSNKLAALLTLVFIIIFNLVLGILPHVDNFSHIGGFVAGFLLGFVFLIQPQFGWVSQRNARNAPREYDATSVKHKHKTYQYVLWVLSLILLIVWFTVGLIMLLRGVDLNNHCSWCHYMSCVPTSKWSCKSRVSCESSQIGNRLNLTCISNRRSNVYVMSEGISSQLQQLCSQLCS